MTPTVVAEPTASPSAPRVRKPRAPRAGAPRPRAHAARVADDEGTTSVTHTDLIGAIGEVIKASRPAEKITVANRTALNPMNPTNAPRKWAKPFYQNWELVEVEDVTPLEYALIPQLKPGLFIRSRKGVPQVEVLFVKRGPQRGVHIRYDNSKQDKSIELMTYAPSLEIMLQKCIAEHKVQAEALQKRRAAGLGDDPEDD